MIQNKLVIVKRYANRKLYRTDESRYTTLNEIVSCIKLGHDVMVIDNASKRDLTKETLLMALTVVNENISLVDIFRLIKA